MFNYKIKYVEKNVPTVGFPINALNKVMSKLENNKINYLFLDKRNNYDVDYKFDNENLNKYSEIYEEARKYVNLKKRIENIVEFLYDEIKNNNIKEKIKKIEEIINEE